PHFLEVYRNTTGDLAVVDAGVDLTNLTQAQRSNAYLSAALKFAKANWRLVPAIIMRKVTGALTPFPETPREGFLEAGRATFQSLSFCSLIVILLFGRGGWLVWM